MEQTDIAYFLLLESHSEGPRLIEQHPEVYHAVCFVTCEEPHKILHYNLRITKANYTSIYCITPIHIQTESHIPVLDL